MTPDVTDGVDAKGRIENGKGPADPGEKKASDTAHEPALEIADQKREPQSGQHDGRVVPVLPERDRVLHHAACVLQIVVLALAEEPAAVTVPEPELGVIRVRFLIAMRMMAQVIGGPFDRGILQRYLP